MICIFEMFSIGIDTELQTFPKILKYIDQQNIKNERGVSKRMRSTEYKERNRCIEAYANTV